MKLIEVVTTYEVRKSAIFEVPDDVDLDNPDHRSILCDAAMQHETECSSKATDAEYMEPDRSEVRGEIDATLSDDDFS